MITPPPREPLDAEERYLKRLLDSLPAADPGPGLDARILAQARRAPEHPAARRRFPGRWGLGAAAAAVLAVALWWPATHRPPAEGPAVSELGQAPATQPAEAPATAERLETRTAAKSAVPAFAPRPAADEAGRSPADWIAEIERLRADGKVEQARESLRRFRERFPEHPVPESLRELTPQRE